MRKATVSLLVLVVLSLGLQHADARHTPGLITGLICLPDGEYAPPGGIKVRLTNDLGTWVEVTIGERANSAFYMFPGSIGEAQTIRYLIQPEDYAGSFYVRQGYYSLGGTTPLKSKATPLHVGDTGVRGVDLDIQRGTTISGTVRMPEGFTANAGGARVQVGNSVGCWINVTIPAGKSSADYVMTVPPGEYRVYFDPFNDERFTRSVYYHEDRTVTLFEGATLVDVREAPAKGIDAILIPYAGSHGPVSGTVFLPEGDVAPKGGLPLLIIAGNNGKQSLVTIPEGQNSVRYSISLPVGDSQLLRYLIQASQYAGSEYIRQGYYNKTGTYLSWDRATPLNVTTQGLTDINFYIKRGNVISGVVSLPEGHVAPPEGVSVQVGSSGSWINVKIPAGEKSVAYYLTVPPGSYIVYFDPFQGGNYVRSVYYGRNGTTRYSATASQVDARQGNVSGINATLIPADK